MIRLRANTKRPVPVIPPNQEDDSQGQDSQNDYAPEPIVSTGFRRRWMRTDVQQSDSSGWLEVVGMRQTSRNHQVAIGCQYRKPSVYTLERTGIAE